MPKGVVVGRRAVHALGDSHRISAGRDVLVTQEVRQAPVRGDDSLADRAGGPHGVRMIGRERAEGLEERAERRSFRRIFVRGGPGLSVSSDHDDPRTNPARGEPEAHLRDFLVNRGRDGLEPGGVVGVVLIGRERERVGHLRQPHLGAGPLVDRHLLEMEAGAVHLQPQLVPQQFSIGPVGIGPAPALGLDEGLQPRQECRRLLGAPRHRLRAVVGEQAVEATIAAGRCRERVPAQQPLEAFVEQREQRDRTAEPPGSVRGDRRRIGPVVRGGPRERR